MACRTRPLRPFQAQAGQLPSPFEIPDNWKFGHHNYLQVDPPPPPPPSIPLPTTIPPKGAAPPANGAPRLAGGVVGCILLHALSVKGRRPQISSPEEN